MWSTRYCLTNWPHPNRSLAPHAPLIRREEVVRRDRGAGVARRQVCGDVGVARADVPARGAQVGGGAADPARRFVAAGGRAPRIGVRGSTEAADQPRAHAAIAANVARSVKPSRTPSAQPITGSAWASGPGSSASIVRVVEPWPHAQRKTTPIVRVNTARPYRCSRSSRPPVIRGWRSPGVVSTQKLRRAGVPGACVDP